MNTQDERKAFEATQNTKVLFERIDYIESMDAYMPKHEFVNNLIVMQSAERFNFGWSMWKAATERAEEKLEGCVVVPEAEFAILPKTITPEIEEILGMPCFKFIKAAQIYRQLGFDIPPKAEKEQSFFMFKFLHLALIHGDKCFDVFESETKAMLEAAQEQSHV